MISPAFTPALFKRQAANWPDFSKPWRRNPSNSSVTALLALSLGSYITALGCFAWVYSAAVHNFAERESFLCRRRQIVHDELDAVVRQQRVQPLLTAEIDS